MKKFGRVMSDIGMTALDVGMMPASAITGKTASDMMGYDYKTNMGRNVLDPAGDTAAIIGSKLTPMVANAVLPGSGSAIAGAQNMVQPQMGGVADNAGSTDNALFAMGGEMDSVGESQLTEFNGPGHEQGGINIPGAEVEGGENKHGSMIQTDRLPATPALKAKLKLDTRKYKYATFAELGRAVKDRFSKVDRNSDTLTKEAMDQQLSYIDQAQEELKAKMMPPQQQGQLQGMPQQQMPMGNSEMQPQHQMPDGSMMPGEQHGGQLQYAYGGKTKYDLGGPYDLNETRSYLDGLSDSPVGSLNLSERSPELNTLNDNRRMGTPGMSSIDTGYKMPVLGVDGSGYGKDNTSIAPKSTMKKKALLPEEKEKKAGNPFSKFATYAPALGSVAQLAMTAANKPTPKDPSMFDTNSDLSPDLVDRTEMDRRISGTYGSVNRDLRNASGGSSGGYLQNRRASGMEEASKRAEGSVQSDSVDAQTLARSKSMNFQQDLQNSSKQFQVTDMNDRDMQAYQSQLSDDVGALSGNVGQVATDVDRDKKLEGMGLYYDQYGRMVDNTGNFVGFDPTKMDNPTKTKT